jgi:phosphoribosylformylglycinamidine synthase
MTSNEWPEGAGRVLLMHRVEVSRKPHLQDTRSRGLIKDIADLGIRSITGAGITDINYFDGSPSPDELEVVCSQALTDRLIQDYRLGPGVYNRCLPDEHSFEVTYKAGVTDPVEESILKSIRDLGITSIRGVKTATRYLLYGNADDCELKLICSRLLVNPTVQQIVSQQIKEKPSPPEYIFKLVTVDILGADRQQLQEINRQLGFSQSEIGAIQQYFTRIGRNPTDAELETLAQTWSEHCGHKTFKASFNFNGKTIDGLLKNTIMKATYELDKPWCLSVFKDNAGVIKFDNEWALAFKVETHNHPSAIEPYGGAATGVGGVVRDVLGTGLLAKPIANTDVFCFGLPDMPYEKLPEGTLHPRRIFKGVRSGVADYGNRLGIPTVNGAILFDERYTSNPLVYCGTVGLIPCWAASMGQQKPGDLIVLVGGKNRQGRHSRSNFRLGRTYPCLHR